MTNNLKIEVLVSNIPEDGSIASQFPSQEYVGQQLAKKANLSPEGRLDPSHAPDYTEIPGLYEHIEDTKDEIGLSIASSLQDAKGYTNQQLSTSLQTKADLVNGKIPFDQIPFSADIEDQIQINVENITAVVDQKVAQVVGQVNQAATAANAYTDTKVAENKAYVDNTIGNVIEDVERLGVSKAVTIPTYLTPEAGVAAGTGVAAGAYYNVRSTEDDAVAIEYQNVGGVPTPSGKSYPSFAYVQEISEYTAMPFSIDRIYYLNARAVLENGEIVKSTVDGNVNNPNNDMTGWLNESKSITRVVQSLAELSTVAGHTDQQLALVMGLGGGRFYWDAVSNEPDDGGLVISVGVGTAGRWKRITQGFIDFEMFGARGFPNNDHTAIRNALGALAKGYRLEAKAGAKYLLTGSDIFIDLPYKSSAVLNFNNAELVCGCIVQISSLQPDVMLSLTGDVRMGATSIPVVSAAEVSVGDVIVLDSPAVRDTIGTTTRQTYRVRDVVDNTIFIFGEVVCDMTAAQIAASGKTGSLTLRLVKALNKVTVNNLQHRHYNYAASPEEVSFRVNKTSVVEVENSTIHGPLRAGIRHTDCGEVYHYGTKAENVGYAKGDTTDGDVGNQYGYAVIATNTWKIRYTACRFAGGWTGLDSAIGVVLTESRASAFENTVRGLSTHPGCWILDIQDSSFINASFGASSTSGVIAKNNTFKAKPTISQNIQLPKKPNNGMIITGNMFIDFAATNGDTFTTAYTGGTGPGSLSENIKIDVDISDNEFTGMHGLLLSELETETIYIQRNKLKTPMTALRTNNYLAVRFPTSLCVIDGNEFWASSISRDIEFYGTVSDGLEIRIENNIKKYSYGNLSFPSLVRLPSRGTATNCRLIVRGNSGNYTSDLLRYTPTAADWVADLVSGNDGFLMPCMREQGWTVKVYANNIMKTLPHAQTVINQNHNNLIVV